MKTCIACKLEIHEKATKCPHCRSFQSKWKTWQLLIGALMLLPLMTLIMNLATKRTEFYDYKNQVTYTHITDHILTNKSGSERIKIIGEIDNQSDKNWYSPDFKFTIKNEKGEFVGAYYESIARATAIAGTKTKVGATSFVGNLPKGYSFEVELIDMREKR